MEQENTLERMGTIYDDRQTDWIRFVRSQTDFFRNAQQHIRDLQCDLEYDNRGEMLRIAE